MGGQRLLGRAGPSRPPRTAGVTGWRAVGPPVTRCLLRAATAPEPGGPGEVWGEPLLPPEGQLPSHPATRGPLLRPPPSKARGAQPYLPLQRHGPHGQAAHGLICDLPPPHGEVVEGVGQLLGVILRRDLRQAGARQQSVPEGTWASGRQRPLLVDTRTCNPPPQPAFRCGLSLLAAFHPPAWPLLTPQRRQHQDRELPAWAPHPALYGLSGLGCCPRWDPGFAVVMPLPLPAPRRGLIRLLRRKCPLTLVVP